jgi:hypothetical protein
LNGAGDEWLISDIDFFDLLMERLYWKKGAGINLKSRRRARVTRFGNFSPIGWLLSLGSFFYY